MPLTMFQASVPVFNQFLTSLSNIIAKASAHASARKIDPTVLVGARLYPDMLPFSRQVQIATDHAKGAMARLAGVDMPSYPDTEATFEELQARIAKTLAFVNEFKPEQLDGSESREVVLTIGGQKMPFSGQSYLIQFALPNFYFHTTTAFAILRHCGVEIGKRDFMGRI